MSMKFYAFLVLSFLVFCSQQAVAQCGDSCLNATPLTVTATGPCTYVNCTNDTASGATASHVPTLPCSGVDNNDVWYTFIVPPGVSQLVGQVHGLVMTTPIIYFYRGTCANLVSLGCNTGNPPASTAALNYSGFIPGERIWVRVKPLGGTPDGTFQVCVYNPCPGGAPANDNPCNATVVNMSANCSAYTTVSTFCATATSGPPLPGCGNYIGGDVWIRTQVGANGHLEVNCQLQTLVNPALAIYTGASCSALTLVACNDDGGVWPLPYLFVTSLAPNATVWIRIWASGSATDYGTVGICLTDPCPGGGPPGDDPCSAIPLTMSPFPCSSYTSVYNTCAGSSTGIQPPNCANYQGGDIWATVTSPSGRIEVNFQELSLNDVGAAIYMGTCSSLVVVACNDDDGPGAMPYLYYSGPPNTTYWIRIWDYSGNNTGTTSLCITDPCPGGTVSPPLYDNPVAMCPPPPLANQLPVSTTGSCTNYIMLNSMCASSTVSTVPANVPIPAGCGGTYPPGAFSGWDVWSTVTVPTTPPLAFIDFNTISGSIYNLDMAVYRVTPPVGSNCNTGALGAYTLMGCDDGNGPGSMPYLHLPYGGANTIQPGDVLYVRMWSNFGGPPGDWGICVNTSCPGGTVAPPGYDDPPCPATANLLPVTGGTCATFQLADLNDCLTPTPSSLATAPVCAFWNNGKDLWFVMQMPVAGSGQLDFNFQDGLSLYDAGMAIYTGTPVACGGTGLTEIACDDDGGNGLLPYISLSNFVPPGAYFYIRVWDYAGDNNGTIGLCVSDPCPSQPVNDTRCNATSLTVSNTCSFNTFQLICANNYDNVGLPPPGCGSPNPTTGTGPGRDIWFSFSAPSSGSVIIDTREGTLTNLDMALYRSSSGNDCTAGFILVACDDNTGLGEMPYLTFTNLLPGVTYYLRVWEHDNDQDGNFSMCIYNPCPSGPPPNNEICNATFIALNNSITGNNNCTTFDPTINNTSAPPPSCWVNTAPFNTNANMNTSWFKAVGSNNYSVVVTPGTLTRPQIAVYTGSTCGLLTAANLKKCDAGLPGGCKSLPNAAVLDYTVPLASDTLFIAVEGANNMMGTFEISVYNTLQSAILPVPFYDCRKAVQVCSPVTSVSNPGRVGSGNQCDLGSSFAYKAYQSAAGATCGSSSTTVTVNNTDGLSVGMSVSASGGTGVLKPGTRVTAITSATQFTISSLPQTALAGAANIITAFIDPSYTSAAGATSSGTTIFVQSTAGLYAGMTVTSSGGTGGNFPPGTTVTSVSGGNQFVASAAPVPSFAGSTVVTGTRYGIDNRFPEVNSSWYFFSTTATPGNLTFEITGNSATNYDFVLWELTGAAAAPGYFSGQNTINDSNVCGSISNTVSYGMPLRSNVYNTALSATGLSSTYLADAAFSAPIPTSSVRTFVMVVMNSGGNSQGFTLDFSSSPINYTANSVVWNGAAGTTDWFESANWGDCTIPQCNTSAIITGGTPNMPLIASNASVKNLIISGGTSLTLGPGVTLLVCGDLTNSGDFRADPSSTVKFVGTGPQTVSGNFNGLNQFANFVVEKGTGAPVTLAVNADIAGDLRTSNANSVLNATGRYIRLGGNFINANGMNTFIGQAGTTLEFNGTGIQSFMNFGNGGARKFSISSVVINQEDAANDYVELDPNGGGNTDNNLRIGNHLSLVSGRLFTNQWEVYNLSSLSSSVTSSPNSYIEGTHSRNVRQAASSGSPYIFATGIGGQLHYASIEKSISGTTSDTIKLRASFNSWPGPVPHGPLSSECATADWSVYEAYDHGYWTIDSVSGTAAIGMYTLNLRPGNSVSNNAGSLSWSIMKRSPSGTGTWSLDGVCRAYAPFSTAYNVYRDQMTGFSDFAITQFNMVAVGTQEAGRTGAFFLYPNPASRQIGILIDAHYAGSAYFISDIYGKTILSGKLDAEKTELDISQLADGIYLFNLEDKSRQLFQVISQ